MTGSPRALLVAGGFFCLVAGIGVVRLHDVFARMHAATKAGTLGLALICVAVMVAGRRPGCRCVEALFVFLFMIASAPVGAHLIGRAAFRTRVPTDPRTRFDPGRRGVPAAAVGRVGGGGGGDGLERPAPLRAGGPPRRTDRGGAGGGAQPADARAAAAGARGGARPRGSSTTARAATP